MQFQFEPNNAPWVITSIAEDHVVIGETQYHSPLFLNHQTCLTDLKSSSFEDIHADDLMRIKAMGHQHILMGTGNTHRWPTPTLKQLADNHDLHIETMHNQALCYTFSLIAHAQPDIGFMLFFDAQTDSTDPNCA